MSNIILNTFFRIFRIVPINDITIFKFLPLIYTANYLFLTIIFYIFIQIKTKFVLPLILVIQLR